MDLNLVIRHFHSSELTGKEGAKQLHLEFPADDDETVPSSHRGRRGTEPGGRAELTCSLSLIGTPVEGFELWQVERENKRGKKDVCLQVTEETSPARPGPGPGVGGPSFASGISKSTPNHS